MENSVEITKEYKIKRFCLISICISMVVIVVLGAIDLVLILKPNADGIGPGDKNSALSEAVNDKKDFVFSEITKEEALEFFNGRMTEIHNGTSYVPEGFLDPELISDGTAHSFMLEDSNNYVSEATKTAFSSSNSDVYIHTYPVDGMYSVSVMMNNGEVVGYWPVQIAFNKKYLNYGSDVDMGDGGEYNYNNKRIATCTYEGNSSRRLKVINTSSDFTKRALPILYLTINQCVPEIWNIYDYEIVEQDDVVTLITYGIDIGYAKNGNDGSENLLDLFTVSCSIDKTTGRFYWEKDDDGNTMTIIKSFPVTAEDFSEYNALPKDF